MVGIPGKSKGCITCKKRRIKCDEAKPTCERCKKSGYVCAGYNTSLHFVNTSTVPFQPKPNQSTAYVGETPVRVVPRIRTTEPVPPELSLVAFKQDVCISFLLHNFVWRTYGKGWLENAAGKLDKLSEQAVRALSNSFFGMHNRQEDIQLQGAMQYGKALSLLRPALSDPRKPGIENLLIPVLILIMHASYEQDTTAAVAHLRGLIMLLQVAGPYKFQKEPLLSAFGSARASLTTSFLVARQRLFLEEQEWKVIPWDLKPFSKTQQNYLVDILVDVPGLLQDATKLQGQGDQQVDEELLSRVKARLYALYHWRFTWELLNPNAAYEVMSPPEARKKRVIPRKLFCQNHGQGAEILLYNAIYIFLFELLQRLSPDTVSDVILAVTETAAHDAGFSDTAPRGILKLPDEVRDSRDLAIEICRTFEYKMLDPNKLDGSNLFFLFPLGIAWPVLVDEEDYRAWMVDMLDSTPVTKGYAIGRQWGWIRRSTTPEQARSGKGTSGLPITVRPSLWLRRDE
ncbi:hypothetical protein BDV96DRAFT_641417 [Lophiotrema nucula]|uniref:Zn(2)-C6 fungal-type domain-containing protein n=1 Tax=Lophiotrema nucula TaxID=690887 RepID=A0A6A5ZM80_9PLEO|nr:hypothetical protein BDV96DRAFT_641417 [Lophiotrema nucula]